MAKGMPTLSSTWERTSAQVGSTPEAMTNSAGISVSTRRTI